MSALDPLERGGSIPDTLRPGEYEAGQPARELAQRLLASLGDHPDAVARTLLRDGARGKRMMPCDCPVYHWLSAAVRRHGQYDWSVIVDSVTASTISLVSIRAGEDYARVELVAPEPVAWFLSKFDSGGYPNLEEE